MRRSAVVSDAIEFEPGELLRELLRRSWVIVLCTIIAAMAVLLVSMFFVEPVYESCTKVYILSRQQGDAGLTYSDLQTAEQLTSDYEELIKSRFVLETVLADFGLDMSADELARAVTVASPVGTRWCAMPRGTTAGILPDIPARRPARKIFLGDKRRFFCCVCAVAG